MTNVQSVWNEIAVQVWSPYELESCLDADSDFGFGFGCGSDFDDEEQEREQERELDSGDEVADADEDADAWSVDLCSSEAGSTTSELREAIEELEEFDGEIVPETPQPQSATESLTESFASLEIVPETPLAARTPVSTPAPVCRKRRLELPATPRRKARAISVRSQDRELSAVRLRLFMGLDMPVRERDEGDLAGAYRVEDLNDRESDGETIASPTY